MTDDNLSNNYRNILKIVGENPEREGLKNTPERAARSFQFLTSGYQGNLDHIVNNAIFETQLNEMVIVKDIELYSLCEHHLLPFIGKCHIAYIPNGKILGLSKFARIVELYARRLQVQENLTQQIAHALLEVTNARGVGVIIEAQHLCMMMRGIEKQNASMTTSVMLGLLKKNPATRAEFLNLIKK
jgi:GTP cyclohydrolase IA